MKSRLFVIFCVAGLLFGCEEKQIYESTEIFDNPLPQTCIYVDADKENYKNEYLYYVTPFGKKYHYSDCFYVREKLSKCTPYTAENAIKYGYEACSRCVEG